MLALTLTVGILIWIAKEVAENTWHATFPQDGTIGFVVSGRRGVNGDADDKEKEKDKASVTLIRTLCNVKGYCFQKGKTDFEIEVGVRRNYAGDKNPYEPFDPNPKKADPSSKEAKKEKTENIRIYPVKVKIGVIDAIVPAFGKSANPGKAGVKSVEETNDDFGWPKWSQWLVEILRPLKWYLRKNFGFFWVSALYPIRHIHNFKISRVRLLEHPVKVEGRDVKVTDWIRDFGGKDFTSYLLWQFPRPFVMEGVEFAGGLKADLLIMSTLQSVMPYRPVFPYEGNFFPLLSTAIHGANIDAFRNVDLLDFIQNWKTGYASDYYLKVLSRVNIPAESMRDLETMPTEEFKKLLPRTTEGKKNKNGVTKSVIVSGEPYLINSQSGAGVIHTRGTIPEFGIYVRNGGIVQIIPDKDLLEALNAEQMANLSGAGEYAETDWKAKAKKREGEGRADYLKAQVAAVGENIGVLMAQLGVDRVAGFRGSVYAEAGSEHKLGVMVQTNPEKPKADDSVKVKKGDSGPSPKTK